MNAIKRNFGMSIRAARLGYHWSEKYGVFVRISEADAGNWQIDLAPANKVPIHKRGEYIVWWDTEEIVDMIDGIGHVGAPQSFVVDDNGRIV